MQRLGGNLFFFGVGSAVLHLIHMQFIILAWIDLWGPTVGWAIRITLAVVGGMLWLIGRRNSAKLASPLNG